MLVSSLKGVSTVANILGSCKSEMLAEDLEQCPAWHQQSTNCSFCDDESCFHFLCLIFNLWYSGKPDMFIKIAYNRTRAFLYIIAYNKTRAVWAAVRAVFT